MAWLFMSMGYKFRTFISFTRNAGYYYTLTNYKRAL